MQSFWNILPKPFLILAPMDDVTNTVFRQIITMCGKPDVFFTEFTSTDGMLHPKNKSIKKRLLFTEVERPLVAQLWGNNPENYSKCAKIIENLGFDGIDINMGCPDKKIVKKGSCGGLIHNPTLAKEIILTAKNATKLPVSVKTRLGYKEIHMPWIADILETKPAALTIHLRTVSEMSKVPAHWEQMSEIVKLRNAISKDTLLIGNGDIDSRQDAIQKANEFSLDGIMIGRAIFSNPWIFNSSCTFSEKKVQDKVEMLITHIKLFEKTWDGQGHFDSMRKLYKMYINNFKNAMEYRAHLMTLKTSNEVLKSLEDFLKSVPSAITEQRA